MRIKSPLPAPTVRHLARAALPVLVGLMFAASALALSGKPPGGVAKPIKSPPTAVDDSFTVPQDSGATTLAVRSNDLRGKGPFKITSATDPANGTVAVSRNGKDLSYRPDPGYCNDGPGGQPDTFQYTLKGGSTATVSVTVTCVDEPPVAVDDTKSVAEDDPATTIDVLANDTDPDGGPKSIQSVTQPTNGTVAITNSGADLTYAPNPDYCNGGSPTDDFTYTLSPGGSQTTVSVTVTCVNDPPVAVDDANTVAEDDPATTIDVIANDTDPDGGPKTISSASDPANGTVVLTGGNPGAHTALTYQPDLNYCNDPPGTTPDTFTYTLDGGSTATVSVTVTCDDAAPSVSTSSPANGDLHIASDANITITFSESVSASGGSFTFVCGGSSQDFGVTGSPGTTLTLDPTSSLPEGTNCTVTVLANGISDTDALDPPDQMAADHSFSFTVDAAPAVTATTPADGATDVDPSADIEVDFSEPVTVTTSSFTISCGASDPSFTVGGSGTSTITLDPDADLPAATACTVTAVAAEISDVDTGDPPDHPAADTSFSFTTQDAAPSVTSTSPADGATDVARDPDIVVTFSEPVSAGASAFTLECPSGTAETFTISGSPGATIMLAPDADLPAGETCTVTVIAAEISDVDGVDPPDQMAADLVFSFTLVANQAPTDIALSPTSVDENEPSGTAVGSLSTTDPDAGDTFTYALVSGTGSDDNGSFTIDGDTLRTDEVFDFESKSSYSIRVQTTDSGGLTFEKVFMITINGVNEAPTDIALSNASIDENQPAGTSIGALTATDPDNPQAGQTHSFSLASSGCGGGPFPDNDSFAIVGGDLRSAVSFNFEAKSSYTICVRTTDDGTPSLSFTEQFTITINDVNDPPVGVADSYDGAIGNTLAVVGTSGSGPHVVLTGNVLTNNDTDEDVPAQPLSAVAETNASTGGGTATISSDGSFTFLPGVGDKNQNDTFTYHLTDGIATSSGTVTVGITNSLVWYVNNALGSNGDGRSSSPLNSLAGVNGAGGSGDADGSGDIVFLYQGSGSYGGGIPLEANQQLLGERHGLTVNGNQLVAAGATAPVITNGSGAGVGLANGVEVQGLNISGTSGDGIAGSAVTTATVGTTTPVNISSAGGDGVDLSGAASGNISIASPISGSAGHAVSVANRSGGTTAFSGSIVDTGTGISLGSNTGATINLTGGVTASTGANSAFSATGGGTVNVTGANNTLATTTGTALNVVNTTIGGSGLTFRSIASNGAPNGINLNNTGNANGQLVVSGNGGSCTSAVSCTGGAIQNSTATGISLNGVPGGTSLTRVFVNDSADDGIGGSNVNGLTLDNATVTSNGDTAASGGVHGDHGVDFTDLTGTVAFTSSNVSNNIDSNVVVSNNSGTLNMAATGGTYSGATGGMGDGIFVEGLGTGSQNLNVQGPITFANNVGDHIQHSADADNTTDSDVTINNATMTSPPAAGGGPFCANNILGGGIVLSHGGNVVGGSNLDATVTNNNIQNSCIGAIAVGTTGSVGNQQIARVDATIQNNTIGTAGVAGSGAVQGNGIFVDSNGNSVVRTLITGNQIRQWTNRSGIALDVLDGDAEMSATIRGNVMTDPNSAFAGTTTRGMTIQLGAAQAGDSIDACLDIGHPTDAALKNQVANTGEPPQPDIRYLHEGPNSIVQLVGYAGPASPAITDIANYLQPRNNLVATPTVSGIATAPGSTTTGVASCQLPAG